MTNLSSTSSTQHGLSSDHSSQTFDPKSKILILLVLTFSFLISITFEQLLHSFIWLVLLSWVYHVNWKRLLKKYLFVLPMILGLSFLSLVSQTTIHVLSLMNFKVQYTTLEFTVFLFLRSSLLTLLALTLIESESSFTNIIYGLDSLGFPLFLTNALFFMYRMSLDLELIATQLLDARYVRSQGRRWGRQIFTFKVLGFMIGNLFVRAMLSTENRRMALRVRQFQGEFKHSPVSFSVPGILLVWLTLVFLIINLFLTGIHYLPLGILQ